ncbi:MAG: tetratricopeptide repeat protein [Luteolibacter sp.]
MKAIQKAILSQGIQTPEELEKFLNERLVGKPLDELAAEFAQQGPETDLDRAEDLIDGLDDDASSAEIRRAAEQALAITPYCISAWLMLGVHEPDAAKALEYFDQGIEKGRVRFDGLIEALEDDQGIWGWIEARDFMRLLNNRALVLQELGEFEQAQKTYEEMLELNPGDNQGVRGDLLRLYMIHRRLDDARALLDRYPDDGDIAMAYGRALLVFCETMDRSGFEMPDLEQPGAPKSPPAMMKSLGPEFDLAKKHMRRALKLNPFVPWMITHPQLMGVELDETFSFGGPAEAVAYAQKWALVWYAMGLPFVAMVAAIPSDPLRHAKGSVKRMEFLDLVGQLESLDEVPWWEDFHSGMDETRNA